jgi:hypothetical protein
MASAIPLDEHRLLSSRHMVEYIYERRGMSLHDAKLGSFGFPVYVNHLWTVSMVTDAGRGDAITDDWALLRTIAGGEDQSGRLPFEPGVPARRTEGVREGDTVVVAGYPMAGQTKLVIAAGTVGTVYPDGSFTIERLSQPEGKFHINSETGGLSGGVVLAAPDDVDAGNAPRVVGMFVAWLWNVPLFRENALKAIPLPAAVDEPRLSGPAVE